MAIELPRRATVDDARAIAKVHVASWRAAYRGLLPGERVDAFTVELQELSWRGLIGGAGPPQETFVAQDPGGQVVGFSALCIPSRDGQAHALTGEIAALYVDPAAWRGGVGSALMRRSLDELRRRGCDQTTAWVIAGNVGALEFYAGFGFVADGAQRQSCETLNIRLRVALSALG